MSVVSLIARLDAVRQRADRLRSGGRAAEARQLLEPAVDAAIEECGPDHIATLETMNMLALVDRDLGDLPAARRVLEEAIAAGSFGLGDAHPLMIQMSAQLGGVSAELNNRYEARRNFERVVRLGPAVLGDDDTAVVAARRYLAGQERAAPTGPAGYAESTGTRHSAAHPVEVAPPSGSGDQSRRAAVAALPAAVVHPPAAVAPPPGSGAEAVPEPPRVAATAPPADRAGVPPTHTGDPSTHGIPPPSGRFRNRPDGASTRTPVRRPYPVPSLPTPGPDAGVTWYESVAPQWMDDDRWEDLPGPGGHRGAGRRVAVVALTLLGFAAAVALAAALVVYFSDRSGQRTPSVPGTATSQRAQAGTTLRTAGRVILLGQRPTVNLAGRIRPAAGHRLAAGRLAACQHGVPNRVTRRYTA